MTLNRDALTLAITRLERQDSTYEERIKAADGLRSLVLSAAQEEREPDAWMTEDGRVVNAKTMADAKRDGGAMMSSLKTYTNSLYLAPPSSNKVWNEAVEAAAKVCEGHTFGSPVAAHAIRSLKRPLQAQEQPSAVGNFGDSAQAQIAERARSMALPDYRDASASGAVDDLPPLPEPDVNGTHIDGYSSSVVEAIQREAYELGLSRAQAAQQVEFTDAWQAKHTLTLDGAAKELKAFYDAWPGGLEEIESAIKTARTQAAQQAQPVSNEAIRNWMGKHDVVLKNEAYQALCALLSQSASPSEQETIAKGRITSWLENGKECVGEQPAAQTAVPDEKVLAKVWFHPLPEDDDYEVHDSSYMPSRPEGCSTCIEAVIVSRKWAAAPSPQGGDKP